MGKKRKKRRLAPDKTFQVSKRMILDALRLSGRPGYMREIVRMVKISPDKRGDVRDKVMELLADGEIVQLNDKRYALSQSKDLVEGIISMHPDGFSFVSLAKEAGEDIFIPPGKSGGAVDGDRVSVIVEKMRKKGPEGRVVAVLERNTRTVAGIFCKEAMANVVVPDNEKLFFHLLIPDGLERGATDGQAVIAEIINMPEDGQGPDGRVIEILGDPSMPEVQVRMVVNKYGLSEKFSDEALKQASRYPESITEDDLKGRKDLRSELFITIDGKDARDFDDAVHLRKKGNGYVLTVAIADVSHYVGKDSAIDKDALERGTSVYFPSAVLPMLPEALSNNLCSLMPDVDRLAMVVSVNLDSSGKVKGKTCFKAVIRSCRRFTYEEVNTILAEEFEVEEHLDRDLLPMLYMMSDLAGKLLKQRLKRGCVDFNIPEVLVSLEEAGHIKDISKRERGVSNRMIEEFMLVANESVANYLVERGAPLMFRIHDEPERQKLEDFVDTVRMMGFNFMLPDKIYNQWFQHVIDRVKGTLKEYIINVALLRTMQQAQYSEKNEGHFGLASTAYLHFTSPIRRYPDLVVHRILKGNLRKGRKRPVYGNEKLASMSKHLSNCERTAMEAEREMLDRLKAAYMSEHLGEDFQAIISSITSFGFFVVLKDIFISGMVKLSDMKDDYYIVDLAGNMLRGKRRGKVYSLGSELIVRVKSVNVERRKIDFEPVE